MSATATSVLWRSPVLRSLEYAVLTTGPDGATIEGTVLLALRDIPTRIDYRVRTDPLWRTRSVRVALVQGGKELRMVLQAADHGIWTVKDSHVPELDGCLDIDIAWTPATNTLPIRRLGDGGGGEVAAAWVGVDDDGDPNVNQILVVERLEQRYERLDAHSWRYRADSFEAVLTVDDEGLVVDYGPGRWLAEARLVESTSARREH